MIEEGKWSDRSEIDLAILAAEAGMSQEQFVGELLISLTNSAANQLAADKDTSHNSVSYLIKTDLMKAIITVQFENTQELTKNEIN